MDKQGLYPMILLIFMSNSGRKTLENHQTEDEDENPLQADWVEAPRSIGLGCF